MKSTENLDINTFLNETHRVYEQKSNDNSLRESQLKQVSSYLGKNQHEIKNREKLLKNRVRKLVEKTNTLNKMCQQMCKEIERIDGLIEKEHNNLFDLDQKIDKYSVIFKNYSEKIKNTIEMAEIKNIQCKVYKCIYDSLLIKDTENEIKANIKHFNQIVMNLRNKKQEILNQNILTHRNEKINRYQSENIEIIKQIDDCKLSKENIDKKIGHYQESIQMKKNRISDLNERINDTGTIDYSAKMAYLDHKISMKQLEFGEIEESIMQYHIRLDECRKLYENQYMKKKKTLDLLRKKKLHIRIFMDKVLTQHDLNVKNEAELKTKLDQFGTKISIAEADADLLLSNEVSLSRSEKKVQIFEESKNKKLQRCQRELDNLLNEIQKKKFYEEKPLFDENSDILENELELVEYENQKYLREIEYTKSRIGFYHNEIDVLQNNMKSLKNYADSFVYKCAHKDHEFNEIQNIISHKRISIISKKEMIRFLHSQLENYEMSHRKRLSGKLLSQRIDDLLCSLRTEIMIWTSEGRFFNNKILLQTWNKQLDLYPTLHKCINCDFHCI